jgi:[ribosomal protein S18]-alanine N-acetyltransferase
VRDEQRGLSIAEGRGEMNDGTTAVRIRPMSAEDVPRVLEIADGLAGAPKWAKSIYVAAIDAQNRPRRIALVATGPGDVGVGFAIASLIPPEAELESIAVSGKWQRAGIGRLLVEDLKRMLTSVQVTELVLEVRCSNRSAIGFYESLGFQASGRRPGYYADPKEDATLMRLGVGPCGSAG